MRKREEKPGAILRIAFQTNKPLRPGYPRVYREIPGSKRKIQVLASELETIALPVIQAAVDRAIEELKELENEIP